LKKRSNSFLKLFLVLGVTSYLGILFSITSHEFGHALVAYFCNVPVKEMCIGKKEYALRIDNIPLVKKFYIGPLFLLRDFTHPFQQQTLGYVIYTKSPESKQHNLLISVAGSVTTLLLGCVSLLFTLRMLRIPDVIIEKLWVSCIISYWFIYLTLCDLIPLPGSDMEHIIALFHY